MNHKLAVNHLDFWHIQNSLSCRELTNILCSMSTPTFLFMDMNFIIPKCCGQMTWIHTRLRGHQLQHVSEHQHILPGHCDKGNTMADDLSPFPRTNPGAQRNYNRSNLIFYLCRINNDHSCLQCISFLQWRKTSSRTSRPSIFTPITRHTNIVPVLQYIFSIGSDAMEIIDKKSQTLQSRTELLKRTYTIQNHAPWEEE